MLSVSASVVSAAPGQPVTRVVGQLADRIAHLTSSCVVLTRRNTSIGHCELKSGVDSPSGVRAVTRSAAGLCEALVPKNAGTLSRVDLIHNYSRNADSATLICRWTLAAHPAVTLVISVPASGGYFNDVPFCDHVPSGDICRKTGAGVFITGAWNRSTHSAFLFAQGQKGKVKLSRFGSIALITQTHGTDLALVKAIGTAIRVLP
jgi:hypothetical protein